MTEGTGKVTINGRPVDTYFTESKDRNSVYGPLATTEMQNRVDVSVTVAGGGYTGQAGAVCQGIARALKQFFGITSPETPPEPGVDGEQPAAPSMAKVLRDSGF